jgi:hypothetical protein
MNAENEALVRRLIEAWNKDDWSVWEEMHDPDVIVSAPPGWPEAQTDHGRDAVMRQYRRLKEDLEGQHAEIVTMESAGSQVISGFRWTGRAKGSGIDVEFEIWRVDTIDQGRIVRTVFTRDEAEAREDFGTETA